MIKDNPKFGIEYMSINARDADMREEGRREGLDQGEKKFAELTRKLMEMNRTDDIVRATTDEQFKISLYQEFHIL